MNHATKVVAIMLATFAFTSGCKTDPKPAKLCIPSGVSLKAGEWRTVSYIVGQTPDGCFALAVGDSIEGSFGVCSDGGSSGTGQPDPTDCSCAIEGNKVMSDCTISLDLGSCRETIVTHSVTEFVSSMEIRSESTSTMRFSTSECGSECTVQYRMESRWISGDDCDSGGSGDGVALSSASVLREVVGTLHLPGLAYP